MVYFADNPKHLIEAYVKSGEGIDRAGGFAIQVCVVVKHARCWLTIVKGLGSVLISKVDGDYNNVVGFPAASFFKFLDVLMDDDPDFLDV